MARATSFLCVIATYVAHNVGYMREGQTGVVRQILLGKLEFRMIIEIPKVVADGALGVGGLGDGRISAKMFLVTR